MGYHVCRRSGAKNPTHWHFLPLRSIHFRAVIPHKKEPNQTLQPTRYARG